ncbi:MAG: phosphopantetheine-binding protein [Anaerolineae bacterium]|nr:phosphopantetheine-binding protein [Anaerolineae bacterium]MCO5189562.1 phosphopantetheine-binding protein [Anaerolineae bacterium]MCO5195730.1 phosphopantetheine-binding protein [Anaerolineae bacterium]MCO5204281.1 phosphopantetheine-binding protein [Anaerolineae bacterium]
MQDQQTLHRFITDELLVDEELGTVSADDNLLLAGFIDSLGIMRLIAFMEETFHVNVHPQDVTIENFASINTMAAYLDRNRQLQR